MIYMDIYKCINIEESLFAIDFMLIVIIIFMLLTAKLLTVNLKKSFVQINSITNKVLDGDLTEQIDLELKDEIGEIIKNFNGVITYIVEMVSRIKQTGN